MTEIRFFMGHAEYVLWAALLAACIGAAVAILVGMAMEIRCYDKEPESRLELDDMYKLTECGRNTKEQPHETPREGSGK